jgi:hypothetical protein
VKLLNGISGAFAQTGQQSSVEAQITVDDRRKPHYSDTSGNIRKIEVNFGPLDRRTPQVMIERALFKFLDFQKELVSPGADAFLRSPPWNCA